jgi:hypothetical protein
VSDAGEDLRRFARAVYGGCSGFVEVAYIVRGKTRASHIPVSEFVEDPTPLQDLAESGLDVYLGCTTLSEIPGKGRGKSALRADLPGVWLDLDIDVAGHHKPREDGLRHLASPDEAHEILLAADLPEATALVHSGGGLYAWWLFDEPVDLTGDLADRLSGISLSEAMNAHVAAVAAERGIGVDRVGDIVRILRPPGTLNWKRGAMDPRPVRLLYLDEELRVSPESLLPVVEEVSLGRRFTATEVSDRSTEEGDRPLALPDAVRAASWEELLFPLGWTYGAPVSGATSFLRPGHSVDAGAKPGDGYGGSSGGDDGAKSAGVYADGPEVLVVWSDAAGLPQGQGQRLTKFRVASHLYFDGSEGACSRDLGQAAMARLAGAVCAYDESSSASAPRSIWPASVLDSAVDALGGGWRAGGSTWTVRCVDGLRRLSRG